MDDYHIEYFIDNGDEEIIKLSGLNDKDLKEWRKDMEARALSEYYNKKVKVEIKQKIWFQ